MWTWLQKALGLYEPNEEEIRAAERRYESRRERAEQALARDILSDPRASAQAKRWAKEHFDGLKMPGAHKG